MDTDIKSHLDKWATEQWHDEGERALLVDRLTNLWNSDEPYFASHPHSWWDLLDIANRNDEMHRGHPNATKPTR